VVLIIGSEVHEYCHYDVRLQNDRFNIFSSRFFSSIRLEFKYLAACNLTHSHLDRSAPLTYLSVKLFF
jgi:hypothetical protein